jgi:hypothetical protein
MLQMFHVDVAKVDQDITYVAMPIHVYCKRLFQIFQLFHKYVARVLWVLHMFHTLCCKCWMLHVFHTYVASVSSRCHIFAIAIHVFSSCFKRMLQVFQKYVVNVL